MQRLIDADALKLTGCCVTNNDGSTTVKAAVMEEDIDNAPTIDAEPVRHGKWVVTTEGIVKCSECKRKFILLKENYCPNCGARMDEE